MNEISEITKYTNAWTKSVSRIWMSDSNRLFYCGNITAVQCCQRTSDDQSHTSPSVIALIEANDSTGTSILVFWVRDLTSEVGC